MRFTIRDIPTAMQRNGWSVGAALMNRWFARAGRQMGIDERAGDVTSPDYETRLVTMDWALRFGRVADANQRLLTTWHQGERLVRSRSLLSRRVKAWRTKMGVKGNEPFRFGNLALPTALVDATCQLNIEKVRSILFGTADDFYAAIGNAVLKVAVSGIAAPVAPGRWRLTINEVGTYLRDTYDFNGDQSLGSWGPDGLTRLAVLAPEIAIVAEWPQPEAQGRFFSVSNETFRKYRFHYGRGGDFVIFSDIARYPLSKPIIIEVAA